MTASWRQVAAGMVADPQMNGEQSCIALPDSLGGGADAEIRVRALHLHGDSRYWCLYSVAVLVG